MDPIQFNEQRPRRHGGRRVPARSAWPRLAACARVLGPAAVLLGALAGVGSAADEAVRQWVDPRLDAWVETYQQLHAHPELSLQEQASAAFIAQRLGAAGYQVTVEVGGHGVVSVLENGDGPVVLFRADMDALPITEETGLAYASKVEQVAADGTKVGVMHACGHDIHMMHLLALGEYMVSHRGLWRGTLVLVAQPAEELGRGALAMIEAGLFDRFPRPDYTLALHVESSMPAGQVGLTPGWAMANVDAVDVTFFGRGGHGARPHQAIDPIVVAAEFVIAVQTVVSRRTPPQEAAVITVGAIHAGTKHNVIPDQAHLMITVRSYTDIVRETLLDGIRDVARGVCEAHRCTKPPAIAVRVNYTPAVYNDPALSARAMGVFARTLGAEHVVERAPSMGGEDFGRYGRVSGAPGLLFRLGAAPAAAWNESLQPGGAPLPPLHSSRFAPDAKKALPTGVRASVALLLDLMSPQH